MGEYLFPVRKLTNKFSSISSKEDLQNFVQERSAHVTQTTLYGYLKTRIGTRYAIMVEDEKFSESIIQAEASCCRTLHLLSHHHSELEAR